MNKRFSLALALRQEVRRYVAREILKATRRSRVMQQQLRALKLETSRYRRGLDSLQRRMARARPAGAPQFPRLGANRGRRLSGSTIRALRSRLRMSRAQFAKTVGVSPGSIFGWETGRTAPRKASLARVVELRKMGVRAARAGAKVRRAPATRRRRRLR
jgi:DNA-binding transcriptional regulator YiaG